MLKHDYPGYAEHRSKHETLKQQFSTIEQENRQDPAKLAIKISHFLTNWLIYHIKDEDFKMIAFCCQRMGADPSSTLVHPALSSTTLTVAQWRAEYETGFTLIDDQHKSLFHAINALNNAILTGRAEELLDRVLKSLRNYTTIHFETEERFMLQYGYSDYQDHKEKHDQLRMQVEGFYQQEKAGNAPQLTVAVSHFLTHWLIHHIKDEDQKMINFLRQERQKEQVARALITPG
jgi:hemerythrin-like metal-binding protein